jgi:hypothetical protein
MGAVDTTNTFTATDVITSTKMNNIIDQTVMTSDAITGSTLQVVAPGKLQVAAGGITSNELANDAVTTAVIINNAVTTAKILDDNVTTAKILDDNVTTAKILDANVTTAKIADANVTAAKLDGAQTGTAPIFGARAWVNFNGTGTVAINASGNVSSITDLGIGHYQIDFTTAMQDVNYVTVGTTNNDAGDSSRPVIVIPITNTTSSVTIKTLGTFNNNAAIDCSQIFLAVFR